MTTLVLALALQLASAPAPLAIRADVEPLGRGPTGTVVGIAIQIAPEDRQRAGARVRVSVSLVRGENVMDYGDAVVTLATDGSAILYRDWPIGDATVRVAVESLDGRERGGWSGKVAIPPMQHAFEVPAGSAADAAALSPPPPGGGVRFRPPSRSGGLGALELEVDAPTDTSRVVFSQDDAELLTRQRPPWTVAVNLGEVARRTTVRASAYRADGTFIGEDALVLNGASGKLPVEILVGPKPVVGGGERVVTVAVTGTSLSEVTLRADDRILARWEDCPCVVSLAASALQGVKVLSAEALDRRGVRGDAVQLLGEAGFVQAIRVEQVELPVVVLDARGRPVGDLPRDAFRVLEDGREVSVQSFGTTADLPLSLGVAVDTSGSMKEAFPEVQRAVGGFLANLVRPGDTLFLLTFAWDPKVIVGWTSDRRLVGDALAGIEPDGGTSLHDAVIRTLEQFRGRRGRTAIVLLTDGDDTTSRTGWDVALRYARTARTPIFPIGFRISKLDFFVRDRLKELASATGGEAFFPGANDSLARVYERISDQLRAQYLLSYQSPSTKPAKDFRTVKVIVKGDGLTARTLAGYFPSL
ncbi:MAG: VWA domain-containing protein [Acidobacteriota bacterium]